MKRHHRWILGIVICLLSITILQAQTRRHKEFRKVYTAPEELISLSRTTPFNQALLIFNDLSKKYLKKIIVDPESHNFPIGIDINRTHWLTAFENILKQHGLWYEEYQDYLKIVTTEENKEALSEEEREALENFSTREVKISAIFFEADHTKLREAGMSWSFFRGSGVNLDVSQTSVDERGGLLELQIDPSLDFADILAIFKTMEQDKIGEIISSPQVTVRSGQEGRIQVGSDISITLRDFAGNTINQFYSTGSIIIVKPQVMQLDSIEFVHLNLQIERSNAAQGEAGLEIKKSTAKTTVYLLDGEETIIGGLYVTEESRTREGVPFLKDLPWWFFGLKYVFGFDSKKISKKELLILIKADLLPPLEKRYKEIILGKKKRLSLPSLLKDYEKSIHQFSKPQQQ